MACSCLPKNWLVFCATKTKSGNVRTRKSVEYVKRMVVLESFLAVELSIGLGDLRHSTIGWATSDG